MKLLYSAMYHDSCHPFNALCDKTEAVSDPEALTEPESALIIWGGSDINPAYYKHPMHHTTYPGGARDRVEWSLMMRAIEMGITVIGVCRGAQMGCAASGGYLIQDVDGHHGRHDVTTFDGKQFAVNSIHHQMMVPDDLPEADYQLVGWSTHRLSIKGGIPYYGYRDDQLFVPPENWKEPEYIYFKKTHVHAIQWHPEMMTSDSAATQYVLNYIKEKEDERNQSRSFLSCGC